MFFNLNRLFIVAILASSALFIGCEKEGDSKIIDLLEEGIESSYKYEQCQKIHDRDYYVTYCVQSNDRASIDNVFAMSPKIRITPYESLSTFPSTSADNTEKIIDNTYDKQEQDAIVEVIKNSNIPPKHRLELFFESPKNIFEQSNEKASYRTRSLSDSGAIGAYVKEGGRQVLVSFYSKGCCWYSFGWYNRGGITISPNHTGSYIFETKGYTTYKGAKMSAYTTMTAWLSMTRQLLY